MQSLKDIAFIVEEKEWPNEHWYDCSKLPKRHNKYFYETSDTEDIMKTGKYLLKFNICAAILKFVISWCIIKELSNVMPNVLNKIMLIAHCLIVQTQRKEAHADKDAYLSVRDRLWNPQRSFYWTVWAGRWLVSLRLPSALTVPHKKQTNKQKAQLQYSHKFKVPRSFVKEKP